MIELPVPVFSNPTACPKHHLKIYSVLPQTEKCLNLIGAGMHLVEMQRMSEKKIKESKDSLQNKILKVLRVTLRIENALMSNTNI